MSAPSLAEAKERRAYAGERTLVFVDEIHRFNKSQQDAFLPARAGRRDDHRTSAPRPRTRRSRSTRRSLSAVQGVPARAPRRGRPRRPPSSACASTITTMAFLARVVCRPTTKRCGPSPGSRAATGVAPSPRARHGGRLQRRTGASPWRPSSRSAKKRRSSTTRRATSTTTSRARSSNRCAGRTLDAALYWMMRMLEAGDDPLFMLRRMLIFASEDVGNADARRCLVVSAADHAFQRMWDALRGCIRWRTRACTWRRRRNRTR